ncbi:MAG TPA: universal stress protein [Chloroflexota bacterium]|jgi:nucleotide-binding universal stress UspA family protein|nr:universal stress protein [Chloroflexota bacterium]
MYARILVPRSDTLDADRAARAARVLADLVHAEVITPDVADVAESAEREAQALVEAVRTHDADLVSMTPRDGAAEHVLAHARVPVLAVPPTAETLSRLNSILVPFDGSASSLVALGHATRLARVTGAAMVLLRVVEPLPLWLFDPTLGLNTGPLIDPRWDETRREHAEAYVRQVASQVAESGLEVGADALLGEIASTIGDYASTEALDLIVMGTHGRHGALGKMLGSTAAHVLRTAPRPVLLVRAP